MNLTHITIAVTTTGDAPPRARILGLDVSASGSSALSAAVAALLAAYPHDGAAPALRAALAPFARDERPDAAGAPRDATAGRSRGRRRAR